MRLNLEPLEAIETPAALVATPAESVTDYGMHWRTAPQVPSSSNVTDYGMHWRTTPANNQPSVTDYGMHW